jgi:hypothetical protein
VWQRDAAPSQVYLHIPLRDRAGDLRGATCSRVLAAARAAGAGARIALMPAPRGFVQLDGSNMTLSGALTDSGGTILGVGAGRARREQPIPVAGRYDFYLGGSVGRPVDVSIDGRKVGTAAYQVSYPQQWVLIASRWVSKGVHRIEISRGGVSLHAGNGDGVDLFNRTIGPLVLTPASPPVPQVRYVATAAFARYCRSSAAARWVEVVRGGAA